MQVYGETNVRGSNWYGLKPAVASFLLLPFVNPLLRAIVRQLSPRIQARLPLRLAQVSYRLVSGATVILANPARNHIAREIYWGHGAPLRTADARVLRWVERVCSCPVTFLDIGSYAGLFALVATASHPRTRAITFEILPENHQMIVGNVIANDWVGRIETRLCGLGADPGTLRMPCSLGMASSPSSISLGSGFSSGITIPIDTLDTQVRGIEGPMVIKIDMEGFEADVLAGGAQTLARFKPDIVCEIISDSTRHQEMEALLAPLGYRWWVSTPDRFERMERLEPRSGCRDYILSARPEMNDMLHSLA